MNQDLIFWTPSYRRDYERFALLRESMHRCGITVGHVVVVPPEDVMRFRGVPHARGLTVLSTGEVLPPRAERLRRRGARRWRVWNRLRPRASGWAAQQLIKLSGDVSGARTWVCLDSDVAFARPVGPGAFTAPSGAAALLEIRGWSGPEAKRYNATAAAALGVPAESVDPSLTYTCPIVPFESGTVVRLKAYLERRHQRPWWQVLLDLEVTEFAAYGLFTRHVDELSAVEPVDRRWAWLFYRWDESTFETEVRRVISKPDTVAIMLHSHLPVATVDIRRALLRVWPPAL